MFPYHHVLFVSFCPFFQNSKLKHLLTQEFSGNKDIRHLAETSFSNLNHFRYDYSASNRLFRIPTVWIPQIFKTNPWTKVFQYVATFFPQWLHISERHLHRFIFQVVGIPRSVFPILGQKCLFFSKRKFGKRIFVQLLSKGNTFQQNHHQSVRTCFFSLKRFPNALPETSTAIEFGGVELLWPLSGGESPSGRCRKTSMPGESWLSESWLKGRFH